MRAAEFEKICRYALAEFRECEPAKSKNMRDTATKGELTYADESREEYEFQIKIDGNIAPYGIYTVIPWGDTSPVIINAPKKPSLKGKSSFLWNRGNTPERTPKQNPNEGWIYGAVQHLSDYIAYLIDGKVN